MKRPPPPLTLAGLQRRLDELRPGEEISLAFGQTSDLFGVNDVAQSRMEHFARGHNCILLARPTSLTFRKC